MPGYEIDWNASAAWAQAILSFVGIIASGYIAAKVAGLPALTARHQRLAALASIVGEAVGLLKAAQAFCDEYDARPAGLTHDLGPFDRHLTVVAGLPFLEITPGTLVHGLIQVREDVAKARAHVETINHALVSGSPASRYMGKRIGEWAQNAEMFEAVVAGFAEQAAEAERNWWKPSVHG